MQQVKPKKALGQHFLTDLDVAARIAATLDPYQGIPVVEVGPGMGVLTQFLLPTHPDLTVVEIDNESVAWLKANMPALQGHILEEDFLQLDLGTLFPGHSEFCVIGNYPYNISSQIFFHILDYKDRVKCCSGMLQKEVAERLAAPPGTKARGILSVLLQAWYHRRRTCVQPASKGQIRRGAPHTQCRDRTWMRPGPVQDRGENNLRPTAQNHTQLHKITPATRLPRTRQRPDGNAPRAALCSEISRIDQPAGFHAIRHIRR